MKKVSVIIPIKNAERHLEEQLHAVFAQQGAPETEVILVDSGSTDRSREIAGGYPVRLLTIRPEEFGHGATRNLGAREARGSYLVFLTQDATPADPSWLRNLVRPLEEEESVAGAFSRHIPRPGCSLPLARQIEEEWDQAGGRERIVKRVGSREEFEERKAFYAYFANTSSCLRREVWEKFPFRDVEFGEDADWAERVLLAGYAIVYEPSSAVYHSHDYGLGGQFRQHFDYGRFVRAARLAPPLTIGGSLKTALHSLRADADFIRRKGLSRGRLLGCIAFHAACVAGRWLGEHSGEMPPPLLRALSRQKRIQIK